MQMRCLKPLTVYFLLENGLTAKDEDGHTALHLTGWQGNEDALEIPY